MIFSNNHPLLFLIVIYIYLNKYCDGNGMKQCSRVGQTSSSGTCSADGLEASKLPSEDLPSEAYSHFESHEDVLKDIVAMSSFKEAIGRNNHLFKDKVVLDVGCGTGILSLLAAKSGAAKVIGIDCANIVDFGKVVVKANHLDHIVTLVKARIEEIEELPGGIQQVDIIISNWMGYCMLFESAIFSVIYARDRWLKKGGLIFPDKAVLYLAAIEDTEFKSERVNWWEDVYGFNMSVIKGAASKEPIYDAIDAKQIVTTETVLKVFDMHSIKEQEVMFSKDFTLKMQKTDYVQAFITYFTVVFSHSHTPLGFSTAPSKQITHWKQTLFYLNTDITAKVEEVIKGRFVTRRGRRFTRPVDVNIEVNFKGELMHLHEYNHHRLI